MKTTNCRRGFTLLEKMLIVGIISTLIAVIFIFLRSGVRTDLIL